MSLLRTIFSLFIIISSTSLYAVDTLWVTSSDTSGAGSLAERINEANYDANDVLILFADSVTQIDLNSDLPVINNPNHAISMNGSLSSGSVSISLLTANGSSKGLNILSSNVSVDSIILEDFACGIYLDTGAHNSSVNGCEIINATNYGIDINSSNTTVSNCLISTNVTDGSGIRLNGNGAFIKGGNELLSSTSSGAGIKVLDGGDGSQIGTSVFDSTGYNVIGGFYNGISIDWGSGSEDGTLKIYGNIIGMAKRSFDCTGDSVGAANFRGINLATNGDYIEIGKPGLYLTDDRYANIICGNSSEGILLNSGSSNVGVYGNYIGTDKCGMDGSNYTGIGGYFSTISKVTIGGGNEYEKNVIVYNNNYGINLLGDNNCLHGNYIGTDRQGDTSMPNGLGARMKGDFSSIENNLISGNSGVGLQIESDSAVVSNNYVGTDKEGKLAVPNSSGIQCYSDGALIENNIVSGNLINGIILRAKNISVLNNRIGVGVSNADSIPNEIRGINTGTQIGANSGQPSTGLTIGSSGNGNVIWFNGSETVDPDDAGIYINYVGDVSIQGNDIQFNDRYGIRGVNSANNVVIGGERETEGNVIGGHTSWGITTAAQNSIKNWIIQGNYIGLDKEMNNLSNFRGLLIHQKVGNFQVGGIGEKGNVIGNCSESAIYVTANTDADHVIQGNYIGIGTDLVTNLGNNLDSATNDAGVYINNSDGVTVGGRNEGEGNYFGNNKVAGILVRIGDENKLIGNLFMGGDDEFIVFESNGSGSNKANDGVLEAGIDSMKIDDVGEPMIIYGTTGSSTDTVDVYLTNESQDKIIKYLGWSVPVGTSWSFEWEDYDTSNVILAQRTTSIRNSSLFSDTLSYPCLTTGIYVMADTLVNTYDSVDVSISASIYGTANSILWTPGLTLTDSTIINPVAEDILTTMSYHLVVNDSKNCTYEHDFTIIKPGQTYAQVERSISKGFSDVNNDLLLFVFDLESEPDSLEFNVLDWKRNVVSGITYQYDGDFNYRLDLSGANMTVGDYYHLELVADNKEKYKLRFKYSD